MITWVIVALIICGTVRGQAPEVPVATEPPGGREWNCTLDHREHPTNPNRFQQSAIGFEGLTPEQEAEFIFEQRCPVIHQIFNKDDTTGLCRCLYSAELQAILDSDCTLREEPGMPPYAYSSINPNTNVTEIGDMWELRSCLEVLRPNQIDNYRALNVEPMFFNLSGCRCQWTQAGLDNYVPATGDNPCETLFDYEFGTITVNSDNVGNWVSMHPFFQQNNFSVQEGGNVFDEDTRAAVSRRLADTDFVDLNIITSFRTFDDNNGVGQCIFTNVCELNSGTGGFVDLRYRSSTQTYTLVFFGQTSSCRPQNPGGPNSRQNVQVMYKNGVVSMFANGGVCDVSSLNSPGGLVDPRIKFNSDCPFQIGGRVVTDPIDPNFGLALEPEAKFTGIMFFHSAIRNCEVIPPDIAQRIQF